MIRIFKRGEDNINYRYRDLVLINDEKGIIKFYHQEIKLGFPFSEFIMSLKEAGYISAEDYYKSITKRQSHNIGKTFVKEVEASSQIASEISGFVKLAYHRKQHGKKYNDILECMRKYNLPEETISEKIRLYFENKLVRHTVKVFLEDGNTWITSINGTVTEIINYYIENIWDDSNPEIKNFRKCIKVEFLD